MREYHTTTTNSKNHHISGALRILKHEEERIWRISARCYLVKTFPLDEAIKVSPRGCSSPSCKKLQQPCEHLWATYGAFAALVIQHAWRARTPRGVKHAHRMLGILADDIKGKYLRAVHRELAAAERRVTGGAAL